MRESFQSSRECVHERRLRRCGAGHRYTWCAGGDYAEELGELIAHLAGDGKLDTGVYIGGFWYRESAAWWCEVLRRKTCEGGQTEMEWWVGGGVVVRIGFGGVW